ncbi:hypothetical protein [Nitriliruptor alkaliphilus]|uniref:hypothetical protein n=1 Tax=Nitriliruptor alkaliphilus TaxID=427918 RepID=UPI00069687D8|nr:hypothetical protein [Nitriliruptor alkaliphilus]
MADRRPIAVTVLLALGLWFVVYTAVSLVLGTLAGPLVAGDIDARADAAVIVLTVAAMTVASAAAIRWPRPVGRERWLLLAWPAALALVALLGSPPGTSAWPATVGSLVAVGITAALVRTALARRVG